MGAELKLLGCPFCGTVPVIIEMREPDGFVRSTLIWCDDCSIGHEDEYQSGAAEAWNRRELPARNAALARLDAPGVGGVMDWEPIETAPKDDTLFLIGSYNFRQQWCVDVWSGIVLADEQAKIANGFYERSPHLMWDPTHWRPLPLPPVSP